MLCLQRRSKRYGAAIFRNFLQNSAFQPSRGRLLYIHHVGRSVGCRHILSPLLLPPHNLQFRSETKPIVYLGKVYDADSLLADVNNEND